MTRIKFNPGFSRPSALPGLIFAMVISMTVLGCSSAQSGHAPGVAGGQTLTPGITNYPLAYIKRPVPTTGLDTLDALDLIASIPGGDLYVRDQASAGGAETNVTASITKGTGDVRDLDVSPDGTKLVFSLLKPLDPTMPDIKPTWNIYQYDAATKTVTQLTNNDITSGHDIGAHYLPDGRIVFASTRQLATQSILLDEGRPQYQAVTTLPSGDQQAIFLLHVMNADGTGMHQISFNTHHDFAPSVLNNGQIVFSRWEVVDGKDEISLYRTNPDGTGLALYYGTHSHVTGANRLGTNDNFIQFLNPRERADGKLIAIDRPLEGTQLGGDALVIDANDFVEITQSSTPSPATGVGQTSATALGITTDAGLPSLGGRFASAYPLYDGTNRMLVSWSPCLLLTGSVTTLCNASNIAAATVMQAPPEYTLWIYDFDTGTLSPVLSAAAGIMTVEPVILQARKPVPTFIPDAVPTTVAAQNEVTAGVGILDINSVYDVDGMDTATPNISAQSDPGEAAYYTRPVRFIRIEKAVEKPGRNVRDIDDGAFEPAGNGMREILGYAPVQPDGSVRIEVPAQVPFTIDLLDANARRIEAQHTSWLQLLPGETKTCNGCHDGTNGKSHGRPGLTTPVYTGATTTGLPFFLVSNPDLTAVKNETMAQTLARITCASGGLAPSCSQVLSTDVIYSNIWTSGVVLPAGDVDADFSYTYAAVSGQPAPTNANCVPWTAQCRVTIHYAATLPGVATMQIYLQSLWNLPRTATVKGVANTNVTCTLCHGPVSASNATQMPADQLDLTGSTDGAVVTSYSQLLFPRQGQTINMGVTQIISLPAPMSAGSAMNSTSMFLGIFDPNYQDPNAGQPGEVDHRGFLTPAELRLISEWLDIGAQYYNDPFVAPKK
jgi:hypothetical protein